MWLAGDMYHTLCHMRFTELVKRWVTHDMSNKCHERKFWFICQTHFMYHEISFFSLCIHLNLIAC